MWVARVFTLYPELFPGLLGVGLYKKALEKKLWSLEVINIRDYAMNKHKTVDDTPFGGGSGMVMRADVIANSLDKKISKILGTSEGNALLIAKRMTWNGFDAITSVKLIYHFGYEMVTAI